MSDLGNKEIFAKNLKYYMTLNKKDRIDISRDLNLPYTTVTSWYNAEFYPRIDKIELLANYFCIEKSDLIERKNKHNIEGKIPVLGIVKAGYNYLADENIIGYVTVNDNLNTDEFFALEVKGNSMEPLIYEKDIAIVKKQNDFENGDIVVALVNGDEATIKRAYKTDDRLILQAINSSVQPLVFNRNDIETMPVRISGIVYNITRKFK